MDYRIGQKVVCIATFDGGYGDEIDPVVDSVYTIRGIEPDRPSGYPTGLWLEEIHNEPRMYLGYASPQETSFSADKFRPLVERKNDTAAFIRALLPSKQMEDA